MAKRVRDLEQEIERLNEELVAARQEQSNLQAELNLFRTKENAIVGALTEAQASAAKTVDDAKGRACIIIKDAEDEAKARLAVAEESINEANERAALIIENAQAEARRRMDDAERAVSEYRNNIDRLNGYLTQAAEAAKTFAAQFGDFIAGINPETDVDYALETLPKYHEGMDQGRLPKDYKDPAELMQSIYAIQGRDIPVEDKESRAEDVEEDDRVWTVDEIKVDVNEKDPLIFETDEELDALIDDILSDD